jgi:hypothetical protein
MTMQTALITLALVLAAAAILAAFVWLVLRNGGPAQHPGATADWSPAADLTEVAQAASEAPADLDLSRDYSFHHLRLHLASEHMLLEALDLDDQDAENVHRLDHQQPDLQKLHSIDDLSWTPAAADRARRALEEADGQRVVAGGWRDLIKPPPVPDLLVSLPNPLPIVRGNTDGQPYRSRHHEDTVEMVPQAHAMPEEIHNPALAAFVHGENGAAA